MRQRTRRRAGVGRRPPESVSLAGNLLELIYLGSDRKFVVDIPGIGTITVRVEAGTPGADSVVGPGVTVNWDVADSVVVTDTEPELIA